MILSLFIDHLLRFERRMRHIYLTLSERSAFPDEVRAFWKDLAEDENQHRAYLEQTAGLLNFQEATPAVLEELLARVDETIAAAEAAVQRPDLTLDDALRQALLLENSELHQLDHIWLEGFHPSVESLLHAKMPQEAAHVRRLYDAAYAFSTDRELHKQADAMWSTYQQYQAGGLKEV